MTNMKGLMKGLRYISSVFDQQKEPEIEIGFPTDVKHVAHIGWEGPSVNSPSWMNEFKAPPGIPATPLSLSRDVKDDVPVKRVSQGTIQVSNSALPKPSRRQRSNGVVVQSPTREKSDKLKLRRPTKSKDVSDTNLGTLIDITKKAQRKKLKETSNEVLPRSPRSKAISSDIYPIQSLEIRFGSGGSVSESTNDDQLCSTGLT